MKIPCLLDSALQVIVVIGFDKVVISWPNVSPGAYPHPVIPFHMASLAETCVPNTLHFLLSLSNYIGLAPWK